jgi:hypothetical protein
MAATKIFDIFSASEGKDKKTRWLPVGTLFVTKKDNGKITRSLRLNINPEQRYMVFESTQSKKKVEEAKPKVKVEEPQEVEEFDIEDN